MAIPQKVQNRITMCFCNSMSGNIPQRTESQVSNDVCTVVFIAALFTTAQRWKNSKCPSKYEQINKVWYTHTVEYHAALKRKLQTHAATRMSLEDIGSEVRLSPDPGIEPRSPTLQADSLPAEPQGKPKNPGVGGLFLPSPGDLPSPAVEPGSPALQADSLSAEPRGSPCEVPGGGRLMKTESRAVVAGAGFRVSVPQDQTRSREGWWRWLPSGVNPPNATELYTQKWLGW